MISEYLSHLQFFNALLSLIVMIELMINFRKPIILKVLLLIFLATIFVHNLALLLKLGIFFREIPRVLMPLAGIQILNYLYSFKINKQLIIATGVCLIMLLFNLFTLDFVDFKQHNLLYFIRRTNTILLSVGILTLSFFYYLKMLKSLDDKNLYSKKIEKWIKMTIILFLVGIFNNISVLIFSSNSTIKIISSFVHLTCCFLVIYRPDFINRSEISVGLGKRFRKTIEDQIDAEKFIFEFFSKTYYVQKETSVEDLASKLSVPATKLNDFIIETTKMSFIDLVNKNRVEYFISLVRSEKYSDYTIEALSQLSGFGSRQSLYRNFKRFHGGSPSDLIRMYE